MEIDRLYELQAIKKKLDVLKERQDALTGLLSVVPAIDYSKEKVQSSTLIDPQYAILLEKYESIIRQIESLSLQFVTVGAELTDSILMIDDERQRQVLLQHFISFKTLAQVASDMQITYRYACMLRAKGIDSFRCIKE